ncbi:hypothetical protein BDQ17DRAFT_1315163 [Cyathus striatus]|nr:hypothetical protein BDQ17DRAFT_1315163 [Cyathus striatus]
MSYKYAHDFVVQKQILTEINTQHLQNNTYITNQENSEPLSPIKNTQPSTTRNFTRQQEYLKKLHMHMNKNASPGRKMYLLYGMGGIGKTQITLKYIDESSDSYSWIFWIDATSEVTIDQSLKDIYKTNIKILPSGVSYSAAMIQQWMNTLNDEWLMIFDNADGSPDTVEKFIPPGNKGHILITSRNPEHKRVVSASNSEEVSVMNEETAVELLLKSCGLYDSPEKCYNVATEICAKFHFLPLAIDQAGAYISTGQCSVDKYISVYDKYRLKLMTNKKFKGSSKYNKTVYGTWEISFQKIEEMAKDDNDKESAMTAKYAIKLINMSAFLHHENISDEIFERAAKYYTHHIENYKDNVIPAFIPTMDRELLNLEEYNEWNEMQYRESIGLLLSFSLIKRTVDGAKFGLHPLVQTWCQDRLSLTQKNIWILNARGTLCVSISNEDSATEYKYGNSIPLHITQNLSHETISNIIYYDDIFNILAGVMRMNEHHMELILRSRIFKVYEDTYGKNSTYMLSSMSELATAYRSHGKSTEAEVLEIQVLKMRTRILGKEHPDTLESMHNLAITLQNLGKWKEAEVLQIQVLEMGTKILGKEHPHTLSAMNNLASTLQSLGKWTEAEVLQIQVLEMYTRILGKEHPGTLSIMNNLALTLQKMGKWTEAKVLHIQALEMRTRILGKEHPNTLISMNNLALTLQDMGKWTEAEVLHIQVLEMRTRILGKKHPDTLTAMNNLASTLQKMGKLTEAEVLHIQVLGVRTGVLGGGHPRTLESMNNLALTLQSLGKWTEAEVMQIKVLEMRTRILGKEHPDTLTTMNNLALTLQSLGKSTEAEVLHIQVLEMRTRILGKEHPHTLTAMNNLALTLQSLGKWTEAEVMQIQVLEMRTKILGKEHPDTLTAMNNLALTLQMGVHM